jgi:hypothetical protein
VDVEPSDGYIDARGTTAFYPTDLLTQLDIAAQGLPEERLGSMVCCHGEHMCLQIQTTKTFPVGSNIWRIIGWRRGWSMLWLLSLAPLLHPHAGHPITV